MGDNVPLLNISFFGGRFFKTLSKFTPLFKTGNDSISSFICLPSVPQFRWSHCDQYHISSRSVSDWGEGKPNTFLKSQPLSFCKQLSEDITQPLSLFVPSWTLHRISAAGIGKAAESSLLWVIHELTGKDGKGCEKLRNTSVALPEVSYHLNMFTRNTSTAYKTRRAPS